MISDKRPPNPQGVISPQASTVIHHHNMLFHQKNALKGTQESGKNLFVAVYSPG